MKKDEKYVITLRNGETRNIHILKEPLFSCIVSTEGGRIFLSRKEITERKDVISHGTEAYFLYEPYVGALVNEQAIFDSFRLRRNPIVKLELITY